VSVNLLSFSFCFVPAIAFNSFSPFFVRLLDTFAGINAFGLCVVFLFCVSFLLFV